ncbi:unnamed protein product [Closterium sp. NIES-65]|nr:unnamed protein product [Closterium sp. NIES-65]
MQVRVLISAGALRVSPALLERHPAGRYQVPFPPTHPPPQGSILSLSPSALPLLSAGALRLSPALLERHPAGALRLSPALLEQHPVGALRLSPSLLERHPVGSTYLQLLDGSSNNVAHFLGKVLQILLVNGAGKRSGEGERGSFEEKGSLWGEEQRRLGLGCPRDATSSSGFSTASRSSIGTGSSSSVPGPTNSSTDSIADRTHTTAHRKLAEVIKETQTDPSPRTPSPHAPRNSSSAFSTSLQNTTSSLPFLPHVDRFLLPRHFYFLRIVQSFGPEGLHASLLQHLLAAALLPDLMEDARTCGPGSVSPGAGPGSASAAGSGVGGAAAGSEGFSVATGGEEGRGGEREGAGGGGGEEGPRDNSRMGEARERGEWEKEVIEQLLNRSLLLDINTTSLVGGRVEFEHVWDKATEAQPLCFENVVLPGNLAAILYPGGQEVQAAFLERIDWWLGKGDVGKVGGEAGEEGRRGVVEGKGEQAREGHGEEGKGEGQVGRLGRGGWSAWDRGRTGAGVSLGLQPAGNEKIRLLYLQRTASANQGRRALDHTSHVALVNLFSRLNFDVRAADLGRLGFKEQYAAVRSADVIVAVHGAALAPTCAFLRGVPPVVLLGDETGSVVVEIVPFGTQPTLYQTMAVASGATYIQHQCHAARTFPRDEEFKLLTARDCDRNASCKNYRIHERPVELSQLDLKEIGHALKLAREIAGKARGGVVEAAEGLRERVKEGLCRQCGNGTWPAPGEP